MRVLISGASGMVGSNLLHTYVFDGETPAILVRREPRPNEDWDEIRWSPDDAYIDAGSLGEIDAIVHLAGEPIPGRWTLEKKAQIRNSRIRTTRLLARTAANMDPKPKVMVCASAAGYYGDRGDELLAEDRGPGRGFLADTAIQWEEAADQARDAGIRVANMRFGMILSRDGGALKKMRIPFQTALGATFGSGSQWMPWIALPDVIRALRFAVENEQLEGPVNTVAPGLVTNREFTKTLGGVLSRPAVLRIPGWLLKLVMGEMGEESLLYSQRVVPDKLQQAGFEWTYPNLRHALEAQLLREGHWA